MLTLQKKIKLWHNLLPPIHPFHCFSESQCYLLTALAMHSFARSSFEISQQLFQFMESSLSRDLECLCYYVFWQGCIGRLERQALWKTPPCSKYSFPACLMPVSPLGDAALIGGFLLLCSKCKKYRYPWVFLEDCPGKFLLGVSSSKAFSSGGVSGVSSEPHEMEREECPGNMIVFLRILSFLVGSMWKIMSVSQECQLKSFLELDGKWINITFQQF